MSDYKIKLLGEVKSWGDYKFETQRIARIEYLKKLYESNNLKADLEKIATSLIEKRVI